MTWNEILPLVERAKVGDRAAYGELVERFKASVYATALGRLHDPSEAEELAHEVFIHGWKKIRQLREGRAFAGWLKRITIRMAINRVTRKGPVFGADSEILDAVECGHVEPSAELENREMKVAVRAGLSELKPLDRETLEAFYFRGKSLEEMSIEFDAPEGTIKRRLHVARLRLKEVLESRDERRNVRRERELLAV